MTKLNKRGQVIPLVVFFIDLVFIVCWIYFLADLLTFAGNQMITVGQATGLEAFFYSNLNLWVFFGWIMFNAIAFWGSSGR